VRRVELAVAGGEDLVAVAAVVVELAPHDRALDRSGGTFDGLAGLLDLDLLEGDSGDVLGSVDVADLGIGGVISTGPSLPASQLPRVLSTRPARS